jgi:hypothetical protein
MPPGGADHSPCRSGRRSPATSPAPTVIVAASAPCSCNALSTRPATPHSAKYHCFPPRPESVDLCAGLTMPMTVAGHDAGDVVANGSRGAHLIALSIPDHARFVHVTPPVAESANGAFIRARIHRPLRLRFAPGECPPESLVGADPTGNARRRAATRTSPSDLQMPGRRSSGGKAARRPVAEPLPRALLAGANSAPIKDEHCWNGACDV